MLPIEKLVVLLTRERFNENLVRSFLQNNYKSVMLFLKSNGSIFGITSLERSLLGLCLCLSGRFGDGLRELSLAVEKADLDTRFYGLLFLGAGYHTSGHEISSQRIFEYLKTIDTTGIMERAEMQATHLQPELDIDIQELKPPEVRHSLRYRAFQFHKIITKCEGRLMNLKDDENFQLITTIAQPLFGTVLNFPNLLSLKEIQFTDITFSRLAVYWKKKMRKENLESSKDFRTLITLEVIVGFCNLNKGQFSLSFQNFEFALKVIKDLESQSISLFKKSESHFLRSIYLLYAHSLLQCNSTDGGRLSMVEDLIEIIAELSDFIDTRIEHEFGRLAYYFQIIGDLYLERSIFLVKPVSGTSFYASKESLRESIRKFIILSTIKLNDDSTIRQVYDIILALLGLHGGICLKTLWLFNFLKEFFCLQQALEQTSKDNYLFSSLSRQLVLTCSSFLSKITKLEWDIDPEEREQIIYHSYALPDIRLTSKSLVSFELELPVDFFKTSTPRFESQFEKAHEKESEEFVRLWLKCFQDYHGLVPHEISNMYIELGF